MSPLPTPFTAGNGEEHRRLVAIPRAVLAEDALAAMATSAGTTVQVRVDSFVDGAEPRFSGVLLQPGDGEPGPLPAGALVLSTVVYSLVDTLVDTETGKDDHPDDGIALIAFVRCKPGLSLADFRRHSLTVHGPMDAAMPGLLRYVQCHVRDEAYERSAPPFDCVSIFDFVDLDALKAAMGAPGSAASAADLNAFVDLGSAQVLVTRTVRSDVGRRPT